MQTVRQGLASRSGSILQNGVPLESDKCSLGQLSPGHPDYTRDKTSSLWVLPAVADLNTPYANRRHNRRKVTWSRHQWSGGRPSSCGLHPHALTLGSARHLDCEGDTKHSSRHGL
jgi:hypothetical protein